MKFWRVSRSPAKRTIRTLWTKVTTPGSHAQSCIYDLKDLLPKPTGSKSIWKIRSRQKRALLSYIPHAFTLPPGHDLNFQFSNVGIARNIVRALNQLGYIVDVVDYRDVSFLPRKLYDVFIGHLGYNFESIARRLDKGTVIIYFASTSYWMLHNAQQRVRLDALVQRRGARLAPCRMLDGAEEWALSNAAGIICIGNDVTRQTYSKFAVVHNVNNASYLDNHFEESTRDYDSSRGNFLFLAGGGNVHKGLDLLLETFLRIDAHLYVCTPLEPEFIQVYKRELEKTPNIHVLGWIPMRNHEYYDLMDKCAFSILPSCSEGGAGSVIESMNQGLIPIISKTCGVDIEDSGSTLETCSVDEISEVVEDLSTRPASWIREKSQTARKIATTNFTESAFLKSMREAIEGIICHARQPRSA